MYSILKDKEVQNWKDAYDLMYTIAYADRKLNHKLIDRILVQIHNRMREAFEKNSGYVCRQLRCSDSETPLRGE